MAVALQVVYTYAQGLQWCAQVADGLAFIHAQSPRIIHRDVKLDNVLLSDGAQQVSVVECPAAADQHTYRSALHWWRLSAARDCTAACSACCMV